MYKLNHHSNNNTNNNNSINLNNKELSSSSNSPQFNLNKLNSKLDSKNYSTTYQVRSKISIINKNNLNKLNKNRNN